VTVPPDGVVPVAVPVFTTLPRIHGCGSVKGRSVPHARREARQMRSTRLRPDVPELPVVPPEGVVCRPFSTPEG